MKTQVVTDSIVGIDIANGHLDIYRSFDGVASRIRNHENSIDKFCEELKKLSRLVLVVMEASGGYERRLCVRLAENDIPFSVVNARRVRESCLGARAERRTCAVTQRLRTALALLAIARGHVVNPHR